MSVPNDHQATTGSADERGSSALHPDTVFRLRGVPDRFQLNGIPGLLREAFGESDEFPVEVGSLAQSPHRVGEKVATVTLPEASRVLSRINTTKDNEKEWSLNVHLREGGIVGLRLDTHFYGFTPLHNENDASCTRDLIAISGLNGHAFGSFKQRGGPWMWLRDGLPKDIPNTRIFAYGYDTQLQGSLSVQNITDVGISLRAALNGFFQATNASSRPRRLLFVGHSLGGLVIKEAFLHMKSPMYAKIVEATYGFLFFGVPNLGMAIESLVPMVGDQPNRSFLETLGRNSALLRCHQEQFWTIFRSSPVQILGFYETKLSRTACNVNGLWKMQGPKALLVDFASATVGSHQYHPIDRDHSDMVKFNNVEDPNYRAVLSYVRQLNDESTSPMRGNIAPLSEDDKACLSSLAFTDQEWHKDGVLSVDGTCDWIFSHGTFRDWDMDPRQLLWIRGNPGTGKSTMMKHISHFLDERKPQGQLLATFFFNGRTGGKESLTTLLSLYRALLNQILRQSPEHLLELTTKFKSYKDAQNGSWKWSVDELRRHFAKVVPAISAKRHICILVDALDESGEATARELIEQFQETLAAANKAGGVLKICFSCRHYPVLTLKDGLIVTMETENRKDIEMYVKKRLKPFKRDAHVLEEAILQKAEGVFQWAKLVTNQALDLQIEGYRVKEILLRIQIIPTQLEELYKSLLSWPNHDEGHEHRRKALEIFQWTLFSLDHFTLSQVRCVLDIDDQMKDMPMEEYLEGVRSIEDEDRVRRAVRTLSRGLVEFRFRNMINFGYNDEGYVLEPIHQTVRKYLLEKGLRQLQGSQHEGSLADPHYQIFKTSVKFLFFEGVLEQSLAGDENLIEFLGYSLTNLGNHFCRTDQKKVNAEELLDLFQWPSKSQMPTEWHRYLQRHLYWDERSRYIYFPKFGRDQYLSWPQCNGSTLLHLAAFAGNTSILESAIKRDSYRYLHAEDEMGLTPFLIAVGSGHDEFAVQILSHNQDFEIREISLNNIGSKTTVTHEAAENGMTRTLEKLLEIGADVDGPKGFWQSPLLVATINQQLETCQILLNHRANPDIMDNRFGTPLSAAIWTGNKKLCRLLAQNCNEEPSRSPAPKRANVYNALWPCGSHEEGKVTEDQYQFANGVLRMISRQRGGEFIREVFGPISTPLHDACARGNTKVASFLIDEAAFDVNCEDDAGRTPLFRAVQEEQHSMVEWLFQNHEICYLSRNDWSQLPGNTTIKETYRQMVENYWSGIPGPPLSQLQEDPNTEQYRQLALAALEDSQYCSELGIYEGSSLQGVVGFEQNTFSFRRLCVATIRKAIRKEKGQQRDGVLEP